jgi:hypothetical protein
MNDALNQSNGQAARDDRCGEQASDASRHTTSWIARPIKIE